MDTERRRLGIKRMLECWSTFRRGFQIRLAVSHYQGHIIDVLNFHFILVDQPIALHVTTADASVIALSVDVGVRRSGYRSKIITLELDPVFPESHPPGPEIQ